MSHERLADRLDDCIDHVEWARMGHKLRCVGMRAFEALAEELARIDERKQRTRAVEERTGNGSGVQPDGPAGAIAGERAAMAEVCESP